MAISANTVFEVRTTGDDTNGGGFVTGASGTDRSQQDAAHATLTVLSLVHTTTTQVNVSLTDYTVTTNDVGNIAQLSVNAGALAFYQITAVDTGNNRWTVDRSLGTAGQTVEGKMGGALSSPGHALTNGATVSGNKVYIKAGTYTLTTSTPGSGGPISTGNISTYTEGYQTTRGDLGTRPIIHAGAVTTITIFGNGVSNGGFHQTVVNVEVDGNSGSGVNGFTGAQTNGVYYKCIARNCNQAASNIGFAAHRLLIACEAYSCGSGFQLANASIQIYCFAKDCSGEGFANTGNPISCVAVDCAVGFDNNGSGGNCRMINCVAYSNTGNGFNTTGDTAYVNCVAVNNGGYGFGGGASVRTSFVKCATYNNTSGSVQTTISYLETPVALSGDPFDGAASFDFRPDNTANEGALLRSLGVGVATQTDNKDIGAVQHADSADPPIYQLGM